MVSKSRDQVRLNGGFSIFFGGFLLPGRLILFHTLKMVSRQPVKNDGGRLER